MILTRQTRVSLNSDWISTTGGWPENFKLEPPTDACKRLSQKLREEENCDIVIGMTHSGFVLILNPF